MPCLVVPVAPFCITGLRGGSYLLLVALLSIRC
jgi:hypothetical protein